MELKAFVKPFAWLINFINRTCNKKKIIFKIKKREKAALFKKIILTVALIIINPKTTIPARTVE